MAPVDDTGAILYEKDTFYGFLWPFCGDKLQNIKKTQGSRELIA
jgi:hypothetical protein